jgi:hypothetical protein
MSGTSHFWSRSRSWREKNFGPGPGEKKNLIPVPSETNFGAGPSQKYFGHGPGPKKKDFGPGSVQKKFWYWS